MQGVNGAPATEPGLRNIGQIAIAVHDLEGARRFYHETLGLPLLFSVADQMAFLDCGGVRLMLARPEPGFDHPPSVLYFRVDDIAASFGALAARGVHFVDEPHRVADMGTYELWMAFFRDTERATHALMSEVAKPM
jgi:catechol 2,3-dioxygenase-like lactoylglutathione lyase family enzyme